MDVSPIEVIGNTGQYIVDHQAAIDAFIRMSVAVGVGVTVTGIVFFYIKKIT